MGLVFIFLYFFQANKGIQGQFIRSQFSSFLSSMTVVAAE